MEHSVWDVAGGSPDGKHAGAFVIPPSPLAAAPTSAPQLVPSPLAPPPAQQAPFWPLANAAGTEEEDEMTDGPPGPATAAAPNRPAGAPAAPPSAAQPSDTGNPETEEDESERARKALVIYRGIAPPMYPGGAPLGSQPMVLANASIPPLVMGPGGPTFGPPGGGLPQSILGALANKNRGSLVGPGLMTALDLRGVPDDPTTLGAARRLYRVSSCSSLPAPLDAPDQDQAMEEDDDTPNPNPNPDSSPNPSLYFSSSTSGGNPATLAVIPWSPSPISPPPQTQTSPTPFGPSLYGTPMASSPLSSLSNHGVPSGAPFYGFGAGVQPQPSPPLFNAAFHNVSLPHGGS
eukprot:jgi/Mesen1/1895/ME000143S00947